MSGRGERSDVSVGPFYVREGEHLLIDRRRMVATAQAELDLAERVRQIEEHQRLWHGNRRRNRSAWLGWLIWLTFIGWACFIGWLLQAVLTR
jgi:hypothetical protein